MVGIKYDELYLWDIEKSSDRSGYEIQEKIRQIKEANVEYVIESNRVQSQAIHNELNIPVLCFSNMIMLGAEND